MTFKLGFKNQINHSFLFDLFKAVIIFVTQEWKMLFSELVGELILTRDYLILIINDIQSRLVSRPVRKKGSSAMMDLFAFYTILLSDG